MAIPLLALGLAAAGAAAAGGAAGAGVGKNTFRAGTFSKSGDYDANRFEYGGAPGGANEAANRYQNWAESAQARGGEQVNYGQADWDRMQAGQARIGQQGMADLMARRAQGLVPSIAQMQADRQMQQATAAQASAAASARGAGGIALAQQNAANNTATMQSAISNQAQINAAQERMAAEQGAFNAYSGLRGGDLASQQQSAQQAQYQAQLNAQQRAQNDTMSLGMTQNEMGVRNSQLNAGVQQQQIMANSLNTANQINSGVNQKNADNETNLLKMGLGAIAGGASGGAGVGARAKGGPVSAGKPYLVGERGPELVVPAADGVVIPNGPTMGLLAAADRGGGRLNPDNELGALMALRARGANAGGLFG